MQTHILGLLTPLMGLGFAATFFMLWKVGGLSRHVLGLSIAYVISVCAFLSTHLLPSDGVYVFHLTQALYTIGITLFLASVCDRVGHRIHLPSLAVIYVLSAVALAFSVSLSDDVGPRLIIVNTGYGAMFVMAAATLIAARPRTLIDTAIICVLGMQAADFLIRPNMMLLVETSIASEVYRDSLYYSVIGLTLGVKSIVTAMVLIGATIAEWTTSLRESGERDALTGLRNRGAFEDAMRSLITRAQTERRPLSLVVADIDHFKQVNDIWGHQAGDAAIRELALLIDRMVRGCDVSSRIGGEEFCIAVWDCPEEAAQRLAERIRISFAQMTLPELGEDIRLSASFGVVVAREGEDYGRLFARADNALYSAKRHGRNRVVSHAGIPGAKREEADNHPASLDDRAKEAGLNEDRLKAG